jgi:hypothetical protein
VLLLGCRFEVEQLRERPGEHPEHGDASDHDRDSAEPAGGRLGTMSPYPTVVSVTIPHQRLSTQPIRSSRPSATLRIAEAHRFDVTIEDDKVKSYGVGLVVSFKYGPDVTGLRADVADEWEHTRRELQQSLPVTEGRPFAFHNACGGAPAPGPAQSLPERLRLKLMSSVSVVSVPVTRLLHQTYLTQAQQPLTPRGPSDRDAMPERGGNYEHDPR